MPEVASLIAPLLSVAVGYAFSLFVAQVFVGALLSKAWRQIVTSHDDQWIWHAAAVGYLERGLYTSAWLLSRPEFAAVWLALKVAGRWGRWGEDVTTDGKSIPGRAIYNVFMLGTGLSLLFGFAGGYLAQAIQSGDWRAALLGGLAPVAMAILILGGAAGRLPLLFSGWQVSDQAADADRVDPH